jgi:AcrR family transcriptional regulator
MQDFNVDIQNGHDLEEQIFSKAEILFLSVGIRNTTMDDLAKELGISKKTLYKTIANKADLVHKCVLFDIARKQEEITHLQENTENAIEEMLKIGALILSSIGRYKISIIHDLMRFYPESWQLVTEHKQSFVKKIIENNIRKGIKQGLYRKNINTNIYADFFIHGTDICLNPQIYSEKEFVFSNVFREFLIYHLKAIIANQNDKELLHQINKFLEI